MFTYFYNKFRPVNRMHYIKYGVNSSLLTYFWLLQVYGSLDHCFLMTHIIHEGDLQIYFGVIFLETRHHTQAHITSGTLIHCALSLAARKTQMAVQFCSDFAGQCYGNFCWGLLLLLFFFFFPKIVFNIANLSTWFRVGVSSQNFT